MSKFTANRLATRLPLATAGLAALALLAGAALSTDALAQPAKPATGASGKALIRPSGNPARDNIARLQTTISIEETSTRIGNVIDFIQKETGANLEPIWRGDRSAGLDRDQEISAVYKDLPAIVVLEKVLAKYSNEASAPATWQVNDVGAIQIGLKETFNKMRRVELYDINDLLFVMPIYDNAPEIDLEKVLQNSGGRGGGGGQGSPFRNNQQQNREPVRTKEERARDLIALITQLVEPDQWFGDVPEPKYYQGHIIVDAPDYMHRGINGYPYWPSTFRASSGGVRRFVSLTTDNQLAAVKGFANQPVTGVVGGGGGGGR